MQAVRAAARVKFSWTSPKADSIWTRELSRRSTELNDLKTDVLFRQCKLNPGQDCMSN